MKARGVKDQDRKTKNVGSPSSFSPHTVQITDIRVAPSTTGTATATAASYIAILATAAATVAVAVEAAVCRERVCRERSAER